MQHSSAFDETSQNIAPRGPAPIATDPLELCLALIRRSRS
jgi:hypothetical protein